MKKTRVEPMSRLLCGVIYNKNKSDKDSRVGWKALYAIYVV